MDLKELSCFGRIFLNERLKKSIESHFKIKMNNKLLKRSRQKCLVGRFSHASNLSDEVPVLYCYFVIVIVVVIITFLDCHVHVEDPFKSLNVKFDMENLVIIILLNYG